MQNWLNIINKSINLKTNYIQNIVQFKYIIIIFLILFRLLTRHKTNRAKYYPGQDLNPGHWFSPPMLWQLS